MYWRPESFRVLSRHKLWIALFLVNFARMYARHISGYFVVLARNCLACRLDYIVLNANEKRTNREKGLIPCQFLNTLREPRDRAEWKREIFTFHREKRSRKRLHGLTDFQNFWQVLFSTYHKQKIEAGASISSGPYFIPRKLDDVKFKTNLCMQLVSFIQFLTAIYLIFVLRKSDEEMKQNLKSVFLKFLSKNTLYASATICNPNAFIYLSIQSCRSADTVVLRMTHFAGEESREDKMQLHME